MGIFTYENQGASTYLVYTLSDEEVIDSMSLGMITNNAIQGLSSTMFMQMNEVRYLKYNVSSRIPVTQFFSGQVNKRRLLGVFDGIVNAMLAAEEYMIDTSTILMDLNYIYADVSTCDTVLICLPVTGFAQKKTDMSMFFKELMFSTQFDQTENCDYVTKIINYLNSAGVFSLTDFKVLIRELKDGASVGQAVGRTVGASAAPVGPAQVLVSSSVPNPTPVPVPSPCSNPVPTPPPYPEPMPVPPVSGMPGSGTAALPPVSRQDTGSSEENQEKGMSLLYLLRHYDKENAGIYKAQKEERKRKKDSKEPEKKKKKEKPRKEKKEKQKKGSGFAIPGQMAPPIPPQTPVSSVRSPIQSPSESPVTRPAPIVSIPSSAPSPSAGTVPGGMVPGMGAVPPHISGQGSAPGMPTPPQVSPADVIRNPGADFGPTVFIGGNDKDDQTVIMEGPGGDTENAAPPIHLHLIRRKNNERIPISRGMFRMGRNQDYNDYVVIGNDFVGNTHCHILVRGEEYFIVDDNSKNHTFVDGVMVQPGTEVKLMHGQTITLADEAFEFRLF